MVPLIALKDRSFAFSAPVRAELERRRVSVVGHWDKLLSQIIALMLLICIALWAFTVVLAAQDDDVTLLGLQRSLVVGLACYFTGVLMSEVKEVA